MPASKDDPILHAAGSGSAPAARAIASVSAACVLSAGAASALDARVPRAGALPALIVAAFVLVAGCASSSDEPLRQAPPFKLAKLSGPDSLALDDLRGQYVLMNFWASWCGPCREEVPALVRLHRRFAGAGLTVLGVAVNDLPEDSRDFALRYGIEYLNVIGTDEMTEDYRLSPWIPVTLLIGPDRQVLKQWSGPQSEEMFMAGIREVAPELAPAASGGS